MPCVAFFQNVEGFMRRVCSWEVSFWPVAFGTWMSFSPNWELCVWLPIIANMKTSLLFVSWKVDEVDLDDGKRHVNYFLLSGWLLWLRVFLYLGFGCYIEHKNVLQIFKANNPSRNPFSPVLKVCSSLYHQLTSMPLEKSENMKHVIPSAAYRGCIRPILTSD